MEARGRPTNIATLRTICASMGYQQRPLVNSPLELAGWQINSWYETNRPCSDKFYPSIITCNGGSIWLYQNDSLVSGWFIELTLNVKWNWFSKVCWKINISLPARAPVPKLFSSIFRESTRSTVLVVRLFLFTWFITVWFLKRLSKALVRQRYTDTRRRSSLRWSRGGRRWR